MLIKEDVNGYYRMIREGANALPFMKATYSPFHCIPLIRLPPEILEMVFMYCTSGNLTRDEMRRLYPAGVLLGMEGVTDREIMHGAVKCGLQVALVFLKDMINSAPANEEQESKQGRGMSPPAKKRKVGEHEIR